MSNEFMREEHYIVFKLSDVERYLTDKDRANIAMMKMEIDAGRDCANKPPFKGLIVEADWPEYEPTWRAIEARVNGAQPAPSVPDISDDIIEAIESRAEQSYRRHHSGIRGQQITPADDLSWHIIHATRSVLVEAMEAGRAT